MGNLRPQQPKYSQVAKDQAMAAKTAAASANSIPALRVAVEGNSDAIITLTDAVARLDQLVQQLRSK